MKKIKVLMIAGAMDVGGLENQLMHLLRNADKEKFQIDFTSTIPNAYYREEIEALGGQYIQIPHMALSNPLPYCRTLFRIMKDGQYDIVHSHELFHSGIVLPVAKLAGVPGRFVHAHSWQDGDGTGKKRGIVRTVYNIIMRQLILRCSTVQMACSTLAGKFLYGEKQTYKKSYHLVYNSVETNKFMKNYDQEVSGEFCGDWYNVIHVGRVDRVKNQLFLTEIAKVFKKQGNRMRILCAGSGDAEYTEQIDHAISENGLGEYMKMLGVRSDVDELMGKAHCCVLPSQYEGMPLVLIEAQASGLPCVVADTFSHEVDFGLGKVQWLPLEASAQAWADAIEQAVASGRAPKEAVAAVVNEKRFDSKMFAQTLCDLYEEAVRNENHD